MPAAAQPKFPAEPILSGGGLLLRMPRVAPVVVSLGSGQWETREPWTFEIGKQAGGLLSPMTVPVGFVSDLYSVPWLFTLIVQKDQRDNRPAFIHDWLYATAGGRSHWLNDAPLSRKQCDTALWLAMQGAGIPWLRRGTIYRAVRVGGWWPWMQLEAKGYSVAAPMMGSGRVVDGVDSMDRVDGDPELDANDGGEERV